MEGGQIKRVIYPIFAGLTILAVSVLTLLAGFNFASAADWQDATAEPPNNNVAAPINIGTDAQTKSGNLSLTQDLYMAGATSKICFPDAAGKCIELDTSGNIVIDGLVGGGLWQKVGATNDVYYNAGKVGIGILSASSPAESLEVSDAANTANTARLRITDVNNNPEIQLQYGAPAGDHWAIYTDRNSTSSFNLWGNGENRLTILQNGNIRIGANFNMNDDYLKMKVINNLVLTDTGYHSADYNKDWKISRNERDRVLSYISNYHCDASTVDGYAPGAGDQTCAPHDSDYYGGANWKIDAFEQSRIIGFYNAGIYYINNRTLDGYQPGLPDVIGIYGEAKGSGVVGKATISGGIGIQGLSSSGFGVYGQGLDAGVFGSAPRIGVRGISQNIGIKGELGGNGTVDSSAVLGSIDDLDAGGKAIHGSVYSNNNAWAGYFEGGKGVYAEKAICLGAETNCITDWSGVSAAAGLWTKNPTDLTEIYYNGGNVGIGIADPEKNLHIKTASGNAEIDIQSAGSPYWGIYQDDATDDLKFWNVNNNVTFTNEGQINIGAASTLNFGQYSAFYDATNPAFTPLSISSNQSSAPFQKIISIRNGNSFLAAGLRRLGIAFNLSNENSAGEANKMGALTVESENGYSNSPSLNLWTGGAKRLTITAGGNIGIGATDPGADRLNVAGNIKATGDICTDAGGGKCLSAVSGGASLPSGTVVGQTLLWDGATWNPGTISASSITNNSITTNQILDGTITSVDILDETIVSGDILNGTIQTIDLADGSVTSAKIADGTIAAVDLNQMGAANGQVLKWNGTAWAPAADAGTAYTASGGITLTGTNFTHTAHTGNVTGSTVLTIAANAVTSARIADGAIVAADLANGAVTAAKLNQMAATAGQVLQWSGAAWAPATISGGGAETDPKVGSLASNYLPKWGATSLVDSLIFDNGSSVGVGTASPGAYKLNVNGNLYTSGDLYANALYGRAGGAENIWLGNGSDSVIVQDNLVVNSQIKIAGGNPGADKILTSDVNGLASWKTLPEASANGKGVDYIWMRWDWYPAPTNWIVGSKQSRVGGDGVGDTMGASAISTDSNKSVTLRCPTAYPVLISAGTSCTDGNAASESYPASLGSWRVACQTTIYHPYIICSQ